MKSHPCRDLGRMMTSHPLRTALPVILVLAGCADIPPLDGTLSAAAQAAPYPRLMPLDDIAAAPVIDNTDMDVRIAALQRRAAALRQTDLGPLQ